MRELGCTRVEIGAQTIDEKILLTIKRGHGTKEIVEATKLLKQHGFKVDFHLMPQLPGSTPKKDLWMLNEIFANSDYRPDMIKIYPCTVVDNSELYEWLKNKKYRPYSDRDLIEVLKKFKSSIPYYARISRLIRDIPAHHIKAGNTMTNLRQAIAKEMADDGIRCRCLRCREIGHQKIQKKYKTKLFIEKYQANGGAEYFLSFEDAKRMCVFAFCRLRIDPHGIFPAFIRELHTYGQSLAIDAKEQKAIQHKGLGKKLISEAEKICKKNRIKKLAVISGVGVRNYYHKLGFNLEKTYMVKNLNMI
jgi:elongator complex protein 3